MSQFSQDMFVQRGLKRGDTIVPYLLDKCLHQFGYKQYTPSPPPDYTNDIDVEWIGFYESLIVVFRPTLEVTTSFETGNGYSEWYYCVSHPRLVPSPRNAPWEVSVPVLLSVPLYHKKYMLIETLFSSLPKVIPFKTRCLAETIPVHLIT